MTPKDLDEIEAQIDSTVPYYVPALIAEIRRLRAVHAEATRAERERALRDAQQAVVEACGACDGQGYTVGIETGYGHACDGTDASCSQNCPVPVPVQTQEQCEYCGRPVAAIHALAASDPGEGTSHE